MAEEATVDESVAETTDAQNQAGETDAEQTQAQDTQETNNASTENRSETEQTTEQESGSRESEAEASDWRERITDTKLKEFASRFSSEEDLAKTALQFRQKLSNAIVPPGKDATEEEIADFNKKLGVPESPEEYKVEYSTEDLPEFVDTERLDKGLEEFKKYMHEAGARPEVVQAAAKWYLDDVKSESDALDKAFQQAWEEGETQLRTEWAGDYDANAEHANRAVKQFGGDELIQLFEQATIRGKPVGSHPSVMKAFAQIGRRIGEGGLQIAMGEDEKQQTSEKLDDLTKEAIDAQMGGDRKKADRLFKERDELSKKFYGGE